MMQQRSQPSFKFKTNFSSSLVLQLWQNNLETITAELAEAIQRSPNFFQHSPTLVDLEKIQDAQDFNFAELKKILLQYKIVPIGICNASDIQKERAAIVDLPSVQLQKSSLQEIAPQPAAPQTKSWEKTKIVQQPVRSGMQIYAKDSDLIVTAAVSPGAEIMADGNIHVYAPMRGRILAGVSGDHQAQIFCQHFEAELVAIGGYYLTKEEMQDFPKHSGIIHIYLEQEQLRITTISQ